MGRHPIRDAGQNPGCRSHLCGPNRTVYSQSRPGSPSFELCYPGPEGCVYMVGAPALVILKRCLTRYCREELEREKKACTEGSGRGLGLMGKWEGIEDWYGGRIQQVARLEEVK